jgi:Zn-finger nucleic acid-binding protein
MAYRDVPASCPRCNGELRRRQRRDIWSCPRCRGVHLSMAELRRWLDVLYPDVAHGVVIAARSSARTSARTAEASLLACALCQRRLRPLAVHGVPALRCDADEELWFDGESLGHLFHLADGKQRAQRSWLSRFLAHLFAS